MKRMKRKETEYSLCAKNKLVKKMLFIFIFIF